MKITDFITDEYRALNQKMHESPRGFGQSGKKHASEIIAMSSALGLHSILDYGCGAGTFKAAVQDYPFLTVSEYDPAVPAKDRLPFPVDLVVCTDVLEHVEPAKLTNVLHHIQGLARKSAFLVISLAPGSKTLDDGTDTHRVVESSGWWVATLTSKRPWSIQSFFVRYDNAGKETELSVWLTKDRVKGSPGEILGCTCIMCEYHRGAEAIERGRRS